MPVLPTAGEVLGVGTAKVLWKFQKRRYVLFSDSSRINWGDKTHSLTSQRPLLPHERTTRVGLGPGPKKLLLCECSEGQGSVYAGQFLGYCSPSHGAHPPHFLVTSLCHLPTPFLFVLFAIPSPACAHKRLPKSHYHLSSARNV